MFSKGTSGNPKGRPRQDSAAAVAIARMAGQTFNADGWINVLSGVGTAAKDRREASFFVPDVVQYQAALNLYRGDPLAARVVEMYPDDETRLGFDISISADEDASAAGASGGKELGEFVDDEWTRLGVLKKMRQARIWARAVGGGALVLGANDGQDMREPLDMLRVHAFPWITALESREVVPLYYYTDPRAPKFGQVSHYMITPSQNGMSADPIDMRNVAPLTIVHETRVVAFQGARVTRLQQLGTIPGWGDNIFTRIFPSLRDLNMAMSSAGILVSEFAQPVFKIEDLAKIMAEDNRQLFLARMSAVALARSVCNTVLIDKNEEYKREQTPVTGLPDLLDRFEKKFAADTGYPLQLLFGDAPGGLGASGASSDQVQRYYASVGTNQTHEIVPPLRVITDCIIAASGRKVPKRYTITPRPLSVPTEKEQADTERVQCQTDCDYMDRGVTSNVEVRRNRYEGDTYSRMTHLAAPDATDPTDEDAAAFAAEQKPGAPTSGGNGQPEIAKQAMNGAQITSLLEVVTNVGTKAISRDSGRAILMLAFQLTGSDADSILGPEDFEPVKPAPPSPFGGPPSGAIKPAVPAAPTKPVAPEAVEKPPAPQAPTKPDAPGAAKAEPA